ncbi:MAG: 8-amino-7-oxononanoate synthase [Mariprofundaceae bacterium]|nr:8-amino-7-oxononanoate synthase [Mariprofundaceae bacterium]
MPSSHHLSRHWFLELASTRQRHFSASTQQGVFIDVKGKHLINFSSNDYLGLRTHPQVKAAAIESIEAFGFGSGGSRLVCGDHPQMHQLEAELATWKAYESCLMLGSGVLANLGLMQAMSDRHTHVFSDKLNHASLVDGVRLSGAKSHRFNHLDMVMLAEQLEKNPAQKRIIVSDGVFSMDGDCADVEHLLALAEQHQALLMIDDAHGTGCLGEHYKGLTAKFSGHGSLLEVGTFGKAFGGYGAFILGTHEFIEGLRQRMRTMIYSTALPAAIPAAMLASLALIQTGRLQQTLHKNIQTFLQHSQGLPLIASQTPLQPLLIGSDSEALSMAHKLREEGFFVPAIRPPTVRKGTARLRITLSAAHREDDIKQLTTVLKRLCH